MESKLFVKVCLFFFSVAVWSCAVFGLTGINDNKDVEKMCVGGGCGPNNLDCDAPGSGPGYAVVNCSAWYRDDPSTSTSCACPADNTPVTVNPTSGHCVRPATGKNCVETLHSAQKMHYFGTCSSKTEGCDSIKCPTSATGTQLFFWTTCSAS